MATLVSTGQLTIVDTNDGKSVAEISVYARKASTPNTPTGGAYNFTTQTLTVPTGTDVTWYTTPDGTSGTDTLYISRARATYDPTKQTTTLTSWTTPVQLSGSDGSAAVAASNSNYVHQLSAYADGSVKSYVGSGTTISVVEGGTGLTWVSSATTLTNGTFKITGTTLSPAASITIPSITSATIGDLSGMVADTVSITYNISYLTSKGVSGTISTVQTVDKKLDTPSVAISATNSSFTYNASGTTPSPASSVVTAAASGVSATPNYEFYVGASIVQAKSTTATYNYTPNASYSSMPQTVTVKVYPTSESTTVLAQNSIGMNAARTGATGAPGTSALNIVYTNDSLVVQQTAAGVSTWTGSGGTLQVYEGATALTLYSNTQSTTTPTTAGQYVLDITRVSGDTLTEPATTGQTTTTATIANWAGTLTTVTVYRITAYAKRADGTNSTISVDVSISPAKAGANGNDSTSYWLVTSAPAVQKSISGVYTPSSVTYNIKSATGTASPVNYAGRFIIATSTDGSTYTDKYTSSANESSYSYTVPADIKTIRVRAYLAGGTTTLLDELITTIVSDGATGAPGDPGSTGATGAATFIVYAKNDSNLTAPSGITGGTTTTTNGAAPSGWSKTVPTLDDTNFVQWQSDGTQPAGSTTTTWGTPYLSYFKVAKLSAITTETGTLTIGTTGNLKGGKSTYSDTAAGFWMGYDSNKYKFKIGDNSSSLEWDGSTLNITGNLTGSSTLKIGLISGSTYGFEVTNQGSATIRKYLTVNASSILSNDSAGSNLPALYVSSTTRDAPGIYTVSGYDGGIRYQAHAIRGYATWLRPGGPLTTGGIVGAISDYDFLADGSGIGYGNFTGAHEAIIGLDQPIEVGNILVDVCIVERDGISSATAMVSVSNKPNQKGVVGVLSAFSGLLNTVKPSGFKESIDQETGQYIMKPSYYTYKDDYNYVNLNSVGEGQVNVCGEGGDIELGDLIVTSSIPGKGMKQADDIIRSYTVARARESVTFTSPTEVKQIACIYLCG